MLEHVVTIILEILIPICELIGIFVVAVSALSAFLHYLYGLIKKDAYDIKFQQSNG